MTDHPNSVVVFAAGFGTRMGALTKNLPKPLIQVAGVTLVDRALALAEAVDPDQIVANLHYRADQLCDHLTPKGVVTSYEPEILETGGGLKAALPLLGDKPVYTINPDAIWRGPNPLLLLRAAWRPEHMDALLMCVPISRVSGYCGTGDFAANPDGRIQRGTGLVYGGVQIVKTEGLNAISDRSFSLNVLWDRIQTEKKLYCTLYPGHWCDVGHPAGIALAENLLADGDV